MRPFDLVKACKTANSYIYFSRSDWFGACPEVVNQHHGFRTGAYGRSQIIAADLHLKLTHSTIFIAYNDYGLTLSNFLIASDLRSQAVRRRQSCGSLNDYQAE
jgi:hypothetical protein